jgi:hypothetical protein
MKRSLRPLMTDSRAKCVQDAGQWDRQHGCKNQQREPDNGAQREKCAHASMLSRDRYRVSTPDGWRFSDADVFETTYPDRVRARTFGSSTLTKILRKLPSRFELLDV